MALSDSRARAAATFNRRQGYGPDVVADILELVGLDANAELDEAAARAIAAWQAREGLGADGKLGARTIEAMEVEWLADKRGDDDEGEDAGEAPPPRASAAASEDDSWYIDRRDEKRVKARGKPKRQRRWERITGITLHQTACIFNNPRAANVLNVPAHAMTFAGGEVVLLNRPTAYMAHAHRLNASTIGIEISAMACGVEGVFVERRGKRGPNTFWRPKTRPDCQPVEATDAQIEATRKLIRYYIELVAQKGSKIEHVYAHRQSAAKLADPGSRIWKQLGLWAQEEFGLGNGPRKNYCIGDGKPIPTAWDPRVEKVPYSNQYKGY